MDGIEKAPTAQASKPPKSPKLPKEPKPPKAPKEPKPPKEPKAPKKPTWASPQSGESKRWPRLPILPSVMPRIPSVSPVIPDARCCAVGVGGRAADSRWVVSPSARGYTLPGQGGPAHAPVRRPKPKLAPAMTMFGGGADPDTKTAADLEREAAEREAIQDRVQSGIGSPGPQGYAALVLPNPGYNPQAWLTALQLPQAWVTYALRCTPESDALFKGDNVAICRQNIAIDSQCDFVICAGDRAWYAITGRKTLPRSSGRVHLTLRGGRRVPVILIDDDAHVNVFALQEALRRISTVHTKIPPQLPDPIPHDSFTKEDFWDALRDEGAIAVDVETYGDMPADNFRIISMAFSLREVCWTWKAEEVPDWALDALRDPSICKIMHNAVFDSRAILRHYNIKMENIADTLAMRKLLNPDGDGTLDALAEIMGHYSHKWVADVHLAALQQAASVLDLKTPKAQAGSLTRRASKWYDGGELLVHQLERVEAMGGLPKEERVMSRVFAYMDVETLREYNSMDAGTTMAAWHYLSEVIEKGPMAKFYTEHVAPALESVVAMALTGVPCDKMQMEEVAVRIDDQLQPLVEDFRAKYHCDPFGRKDILERAKAYRVVTHDAVSLDAKALQDSEHPFAKALHEIRRVKKRLDAAIALYDSIWPDGRIRPSFNLTGARTGRLSCSRPNLQNVPKPDADQESKWIRECFKAAEGTTILAIDYSQVELIVMASLAGDDVALRAIQQGSYHMDTARIVVPIAFGIPPEEVEEKKHKRYGKIANFGWLYGAGDKTTAERFNCTPEVARQMRNQVLGRKFARTGAFIERVQREAAKTGVARTYFRGQPSRIRPLYDFGSPIKQKQSLAKRQSFNTRIQGSANDVCLMALVRLHRFANQVNEANGDTIIEITQSVHDMLGFIVKDEWLESLLPDIIYLMTNDVGYPVDVEAEIGKDMGNMHKYEKSTEAPVVH